MVKPKAYFFFYFFIFIKNIKKLFILLFGVLYSFNMDMDSGETDEEYMINCAKGARQFILKEKLEDLPKARLHLKM